MHGKIDVHTHILPENWPDLRQRYGGGSGWVQLKHHEPAQAQMLRDGEVFRVIKSNCWDPVVRVAEMDAAGIATQAICTVPVMFAYNQKPEHTDDWSRLLNDHLAGVCRDFPGRFVGLGTLPLQAPTLALRELERCVTELGFAGVQIGSHVNDWNLDAPELFDVFAAAQDLNIAVLVHPWDMIGLGKWKKYWLPWLVGMPAETAMAMCCMIFGGVLERLPRLRVMFSHGGGAFPFLIGRLETGFKGRPDLVATDNPHNPRKYLRQIWVDSAVYDPAPLRYLLDMFGPERVALGSDYPFPLGEPVAGQVIESMDDLSAGVKQRLLIDSPREFLGIG